MSVFVGRDGNISVLRVGIALVILGAAVIVGGFVLFQLELRTFKAPLNVDLFPGGQQISSEESGQRSRKVVYVVPATTPEDVMAFYDQRMAEYYDEPLNAISRERCFRFPVADNFDGYVEGAGTVPYEFRCNFNDSGWGGALRYTTVVIQPGVRDDTENIDMTGSTIIIYDQYWD